MLHFLEYISKLKKLEKEFNINEFHSLISTKNNISIYKEWKEKNNQLRLEYRAGNNECIPRSDEKIIIQYLESNNFFQRAKTVYLIDLFPHFSEKIFDACIHSGVNTLNPSANSIFVKSPIRVYGVFDVKKKVIGYIKEGSKLEKIGAIRLLYWTRGLIGKTSRIIYKWDGVEYRKQFVKRKPNDGFEKRVKELERLKEETECFLIHRIEEENDIEILRELFIRVPNEIEALYPSNQNKARILFDLKHRESVLKINLPYRKLRGVTDQNRRDELLIEIREEVKKLKTDVEHKIQESLKNWKGN